MAVVEPFEGSLVAAGCQRGEPPVVEDAEPARSRALALEVGHAEPDRGTRPSISVRPVTGMDRRGRLGLPGRVNCVATKRSHMPSVIRLRCRMSRCAEGSRGSGSSAMGR